VRAFAASVGLNPDGLSPRDGSGLSRQDAVTPRNLVALLTHVERAAAPDVRRAFVDALPVGGVDGTLEDRFVGTTAAGVVRAKTGSLTGVSCLSGYVLTRAGEPLAFSILMNSVLRGSSAARAAQDALVVALMDVPVARVSR
jgi:D-alanyl-D-alanine carboxypeptidase/D-alanyl-D-alanine-endopeptidase (penicillin-binding protein 4)